jgi:hypothetical protein
MQWKPGATAKGKARRDLARGNDSDINKELSDISTTREKQWHNLA